MEQFKYVIGGDIYIQRPLVLLQIDQLTDLLSRVVIPSNLNVQAVIVAIGRHISRALAIVLIEEAAVKDKSKKEIGQHLLARDVEALANEIRCTVDPETIVQVIEDFFDCNPIASLLERFAGMTEKLSGKIAAMKAGLKASASSSPEAISPGGTPSSANTPSPT